MKKIYRLIIVLLIAFSIYLYIVFSPRDYALSYQMDDCQVSERYDRKLKYYEFIIRYQERDYPVIITDKYTNKRQIVNDIARLEEEDNICLSILINNKVFPVCYQNDQLIDFRHLDVAFKDQYQDLITEYSSKVIDTYENLKIYNYLNKSYYIWNYKGYNYLNKDNKKMINIIKEDEYNNALAYQINQFLITPNYDQKFFFKEYFVLNTRNQELSSFLLDKEISYSSYYLGDYDNTIYLLDKKAKTQYAVNVKKSEIKIVGTESKEGLYYNQGWSHVSINKMINEEHFFIKEQVYHYQTIDGKLYSIIKDYKTLVSNGPIKDIILINCEQIYYLIDSVLYYYSPLTGEVKIMENIEWSFNHLNKIFVFD